MEQLALFEVASKGVLGLLLILVPLTVAKALGLNRDASRFWPRLAGFLLLGIAAGAALPALTPHARGGIGPAGLVAINLALAAGLLIPLVWGTAAPFRRGRLFILALGLTALASAFLEIAHL